MAEDIFRGIGWGLFVAISWYIPLKAYTEKTTLRTELVESKWPPLLISYVVWYVPVLILLLGAILFDNFAGCSSVTIVAILWAYTGHKWIQNQSSDDNSSTH
ncbi:MAG: hypothetical protein H6650_13815 [Ardenticatenales bacterium]|nr:hypothetical protein [Ardenticatenales bacterium]